MASAISICFSGSKDDPLGKELERISKFDPDEIIEAERQDISKMRAMFLTRYPHLHRGKARVNNNGR